jgi:recombinational DNA repair protein RecT
MAEEKKEVAKVNPIRQFEQQVALAKSVKDVLKIDIVKNRYVANHTAITGHADGLQVYEQESFAFIDLANNKPEIMECDPFSIVAGFLRASNYALSFSGNDLSVYPRSVKQKDGSYKKVLIVEPQAHGKKRLIGRMPEVKTVDEGVLVFKNDVFKYDPKRKKVTVHEQSWPVPKAEEATVIAAYCTIHFKDGHEEDVIVSIDEIKAARAKSKMEGGGELWKSHFGEACKKTTYNRAFKVHWKKPQTDVLFKYDQPSGEDTVDAQSEDVSDAVDPTVVDQAQPAVDQKDDFKSNVNESTGEVYEEAKVVQKEKKKPEAFI